MAAAWWPVLGDRCDHSPCRRRVARLWERLTVAVASTGALTVEPMVVTGSRALGARGWLGAGMGWGAGPRVGRALRSLARPSAWVRSSSSFSCLASPRAAGSARSMTAMAAASWP